MTDFLTRGPEQPMLVGISGYIGSGKDTVGKIIQKLMPPSPWDRGWEIKKYAAKLKQIAALLTGYPVEKFEDQDFKASYLPHEWSYLPLDEVMTDGVGLAFKKMTVREFLQKLGTDAIRDGLHKETWVNALFSDLRPESRWVITDMRFPNEAQRIKDLGGKTIRVDRSRVAQSPSDNRLHASEIALDGWSFDYYIRNSGTIDELTTEVKKCLQMLDIMPL